MSHTHILQVDHAPKRKGDRLQYLFRIIEYRSKKIVAVGEQYSRKADVFKTIENAFGPLVDSGKFILIDLCELKRTKLKRSE